jgi:o-succinylbenzoate---CoA ligase
MDRRVTAGRLVAIEGQGPRLARAIEGRWEAGDAVLPLPPDDPPGTVEQLLAGLRPDVALGPAGRRLPEPLPTDPRVGLVVATSGTTGPPSGVELDRDALLASARASLDRLGSGGGGRWLCCLPLHHVAGVAVLVRARLSGIPAVVLERFDVAAVADAVESGAVDHVSLVPTMLRRLLDAGVDVRRFARILLGGAAPPPGLLEDAERAGARVVVSYGMTETSGGCVYDGVPLDGVEVALRPATCAPSDGGRIAVRGPVVMRGYRGDPARTAAVTEEGWFVSNDLGRWHRGRLEVLGRADDVIVSGGENVHAAAVARALLTHPAVADVRVEGRADPEWGERVVAVVVPADPSAPPALGALREHVGSRLGRHAAPRELEVVPRLDRTELGKVRRARR